MKRIDAAIEKFPNGVTYDDKTFIGLEFIGEFCPFNLQVGKDDYDWSQGLSDNVSGCRGISCIECWNKDVD